MKLTPGAAILWTVLVPGLAHLRLGHVMRAVLAFATSAGIFFAGAAMVGDRIWYFELFEPMEFLKPVLDRLPLQLLPEAPNLGCRRHRAVQRSGRWGRRGSHAQQETVLRGGVPTLPDLQCGDPGPSEPWSAVPTRPERLPSDRLLQAKPSEGQ